MTSTSAPQAPAGHLLAVPTRRIGLDASPVVCRWSPDGAMLAVALADDRVAILPARDLSGDPVMRITLGHVRTLAWSPDSRTLLVTMTTRMGVVAVPSGTVGHLVNADDSFHTAWSPDGRHVAVGDRSGGVVLRDARSLEVVSRPEPTRNEDNLSVAWSPAGELATGSWYRAGSGKRGGPAEAAIRFWSVPGNRLRERCAVRRPHGAGYVKAVQWMPSGEWLVSYGNDDAVRLWDPESGALRRTLEQIRPGGPAAIAISADGALLVAQGEKWAVVWSTEDWNPLGVLPLGITRARVNDMPCAGFRPGGMEYAVAREDGLDVVDLAAVAAQRPETAGPGARRRGGGAQYRNAKVVLVGDSGVGKSGLAMVLAGEAYRPTSSTHGRHVRNLDRQEADLAGRTETREILLWDLAGQPGYRLFHRLSLRDVAVALVLFDARSESEPFAGVGYWARALDEAACGAPLVKLLVSARSDRGGPAVSRQRIDEVLTRYGFAGYADTSAERGWGVEELRAAVLKAIAWERLPVVSAPSTFLDVQRFLGAEKERGRLLAGRDELLDRFARPAGGTAGQPGTAGSTVDPAVFDICLRRQETAGLVTHLAAVGLWLLQPEVLDNYAAWLAHAARQEPDGLGFLPERRALTGDFRREPLARPEDERVMLLAAVEEVVGRGLVLRVPTDRGEMLVFPSEVRADLPDYPGGYALAVAFHFGGPVSAIYSSIVVRLANSLTFRRHALYRNAALFHAPRGQVCGLAVHYPRPGDEALGRLVVFFGPHTEKDVELLFLRYVNEQLEQLALAGSVARERIYQCPKGHPPVPPEFVALRRDEGQRTVICPGCGVHLPLDDLAEQSTRPDERVEAMQRNAAYQQERQQRLTVLPERVREARYHVFLCHNSRDKPAVRELAGRLRDEGVLAWLDEQGILAGDQFVAGMEQMVDTVPAVAVIVGPHRIGRWQTQEYYVFLQRFVEHRAEDGEPLRIVPVLLPGAPDPDGLPPFLRTFDRVDFRQGGLDDRDAMHTLLHALL